MKIILAIGMGALLMAAAPIKLAPADDKPAQPIGAAARHKHGPDPMAKPPEDVGSAEDPVTPPSTPPAPPATPDKPANTASPKAL